MKKKSLAFGVILMSLAVFVCSACSSRSNKYDSRHLNAMNVDKLWEYSKGDSQTIAFKDTGISAAKPSSQRQTVHRKQRQLQADMLRCCAIIINLPIKPKYLKSCGRWTQKAAIRSTISLHLTKGHL